MSASAVGSGWASRVRDAWTALIGDAMRLGARDLQRVLDASQALALDTGPGDFVGSAAAVLDSLIGGDLVGFNDLDVTRASVGVSFPLEREQPAPWPNSPSEALQDHPILIHFLSTRDPTPCRVSDVTTQRRWLSSGAYECFFRPNGQRFLLAVPVEHTGLRGAGYTISRSSSNFSERDVQVVSAFQAALTLHHRRNEVAPTAGSPLTPREHEIVLLLAKGLTARAIARRADISPGTVRKHLQNVYKKLGVSDRLAAVDHLRLNGWL